MRIRGENLNVRHFENLVFRRGLFGDFRVVIREDGISVKLEDYAAPPGAADAVGRDFVSRFKMPVNVELVPFGAITDYREPRKSKPILKVEDQRAASTQERPTLL